MFLKEIEQTLGNEPLYEEVVPEPEDLDDFDEQRALPTTTTTPTSTPPIPEPEDTEMMGFITEETSAFWADNKDARVFQTPGVAGKYYQDENGDVYKVQIGPDEKVEDDLLIMSIRQANERPVASLSPGTTQRYFTIDTPPTAPVTTGFIGTKLNGKDQYGIGNDRFIQEEDGTWYRDGFFTAGEQVTNEGIIEALDAAKTQKENLREAGITGIILDSEGNSLGTDITRNVDGTISTNVNIPTAPTADYTGEDLFGRDQYKFEDVNYIKKDGVWYEDELFWR